MEELERIVLKDAEFSGSVLTSLKKVRNGDRLEDIGICWNTCRFYKNPYQDVCWAYLKSLFPYWEFFSGDRSYPVPHPNTLPDSGFYRGGSLYDPNTKYGALRLNLLNFLIATIESILEEHV